MTRRGMVLAVSAALALGVGCARRGASALPPRPDPGVGRREQPLEGSLPRFPDGKPHSFADDRGQVVLLDIWATWCDPCRDALPLYQQLAADYGPRGLRVYALSVDADPSQIQRFVDENKITLQILRDTVSYAEGTLGVRVMPSTFLLDRQGRIRYVHEGFAEDFVAQYRREIEELLAE